MGGSNPIIVQGMAKTQTSDVGATLSQIKAMAVAGAEIVRLAVPDEEAASKLADIREGSPLPVVADIHFDYRLALLALEAGFHKLRINPGNIGSRDRVRTIVREARDRQVPIRVGVNAGSLERDNEDRWGRTSRALVESALRSTALLEDLGLEDIVLSVKASDVPTTVNAYLELSQRTRHPLHLGITEAGGPRAGTVKSATGIGMCLAMGVGDTLRVSLTADPVQELRVAWDLLAAWGLRRRGVEVVSCPTCGRCQVDLITLAQEVEKAVEGLTGDITVAVMGCAVNGPGEARAADLGVAMGARGAVLFRQGQIVRQVAVDDVVGELLEEIKHLQIDP